MRGDHVEADLQVGRSDAPVRSADLKVGLYVLCVCLFPAGLLFAQRDAATTTPPATARISGVVMSLATNIDALPKPVPRVIVTLTGGEIPGGRATISDDQGRFAFERLPAGRFTLSGTRPGYLLATYGASKPGRPGIPLQIAAGQQITNANLSLAHGAAIAGTLRDQSGDAVSNTTVVAMRLPLPGSSPMLTFAESTASDDRGAYRIYGLMPGDYVVATIPGRGNGDLSMLTSAEIDDALKVLQQRVGLGGGSSPSVSQPAPAMTTPPAATPATNIQYAYAPVFYPGTASAASAGKVSVGLGDERAGVDFVVQLTRMGTMSGTLVAPDGGAPQQVAFVISSVGVQLPSLVGASPTFASETTPTGRAFKYTNLAPGRYTVTAQSTVPTVRWARTEVDVAGTDVTGVSMVLQPALTLLGRMVFDGTMAPPENVPAVRVNLLYINGFGSGRSGNTNLGNVPVAPAVVETDGRFTIGGIIPETFRFTATVPGPPGWWLRSAMMGTQDVLDVPLVISATGNLPGLVLTFSDRHTALSGTLQTPAGQPAPAYFIVVYPADRALWRPLARRIQSARAGTDGKWIVKDLPPGDYLVAALQDLDPLDLLDPAFFDQLLAASAKLTLGDGEQKTFDLRIGG